MRMFKIYFYGNWIANNLFIVIIIVIILAILLSYFILLQAVFWPQCHPFSSFSSSLSSSHPIYLPIMHSSDKLLPRLYASFRLFLIIFKTNTLVTKSAQVFFLRYNTPPVFPKEIIRAHQMLY